VPYGYFKFDAVHDSARTAFGTPRSMCCRTVFGRRRQDLISARAKAVGLAVKPRSSPAQVTGRLEAIFYGDFANQDRNRSDCA
jgi:hypothetical protein